MLLGIAASIVVPQFATRDDLQTTAAARLRWSAEKTAGHQLTYWQQDDRGWQKKA